MPNLSALATPALVLSAQMSPLTLSQQATATTSLLRSDQSQSLYVVGRPIREGGPTSRLFYAEGRVMITGGTLLNCPAPLELRRVSNGFSVNTSGCTLQALENPYRYLLTHTSPPGPELTTIVTRGRPLLEPQRLHVSLTEADRVFLDADRNAYSLLDTTLYCSRPPQITGSVILMLEDCYDRRNLENELESTVRFDVGQNLGHYLLATLSLGLGLAFLFQRLIRRKKDQRL